MNSARDCVVVDTSTLVSVCLFPNSRTALALRTAVTHFRVCGSAETIAQLVGVLQRDKFDRWRPVAERAKFIEEFLRAIELVPITGVRLTQ